MAEPTPPSTNQSSELASRAQTDRSGSVADWAAATNDHLTNGSRDFNFDEEHFAPALGANQQAFYANSDMPANQDGVANGADNESNAQQPGDNPSLNEPANPNANIENDATNMNGDATDQAGNNGTNSGDGAGPPNDGPPTGPPYNGGPQAGGAPAGEPAPDPNLIELKVKDQAGNETHFRVKKTTRLQKIFGAYAAKEGKDLHTLRFLFDGQRLDGGGTPDDNEIEAGDTIEVMLEQLGGGGNTNTIRPNSSTGIAEAAHVFRKADVLSKQGARIAKLVRKARRDLLPATASFTEVMSR